MKKTLIVISLILALTLLAVSCDLGSSQENSNSDDSELSDSLEGDKNDKNDKNNEDDEDEDDNEKDTQEENIFPSSKPSEGLVFITNDYNKGVCWLGGMGTCTDTNVVIPATSPEGDSLVSILQNAFYKTDITTVVIPDSVTVIDSWAFSDCTKLIGVKFGNGLEEINGWAFQDCTSLKYITLPESLLEIHNNAFSGCTSITSFNITKNLKYISSSALPPSLTSITIDPENTHFRMENDCLIEIATYYNTVLYALPNGVIPTDENVKAIGSYAFSKHNDLVSVVIPSNIHTIESSAFDGCENLTAVTIPTSVKHIGGWVFSKCSKLTSINYQGTMEQWLEIEFMGDWDKNMPSYTVHCTDGDITK